MLIRERRLSSLSTTFQRRLGDVGVHHHVVLGAGVVLPPLDRLDVGRRQLPAPHRVGQPGLEARLLLGVAHREPVLVQPDAVLDEHPLEDRALAQEPLVLLGGAVAEHPLDPGAVVPAAVEDDDLAGGGQVLDVALEVPPGALPLGRCRERDDPGLARVEVLGDPLDRRALAGGVAALEDQDDPLPLASYPFLHLDQLGLQTDQLGLVGRLLQARLLRHARHRVRRASARRAGSGRPRAASAAPWCAR